MIEPIWTPSPTRRVSQRLSDYARFVAQRTGQDFRYDYDALHRWSLDDQGGFWSSLIEYSGLAFAGDLAPALLDAQRLPGARWFPNLRLNYAENLLRHPATHEAVISCDESGRRRAYTYGELRDDTLAHMRALAAANLGPGDTVAAILPNIYEALPAMLGATGLGITWCSVSPDFGAPGILDRLGQVSPRVLYATRRYRYNGQIHDITDKLTTVIAALPGLERVVLVDEPPDGDRRIARSVPLTEFLQASRAAPTPEFERFP